MDAGRLRRETGNLCHSFHGLTRVMTDAAQGFQAVLIFPRNKSATFSVLFCSFVKEKQSPAMPGFCLVGIAMLTPLNLCIEAGGA